MVEVVKSNFSELLPAIRESIKNASFITIDTEFTGLITSLSNEPSFFDSLEDRYQKLKQAASSFTIGQLGLTTFTKSVTENVYFAETYIFYLRPHQCGSKERYFLFQASCVDFLAAYNFDFNKFMYEGIPYLNEEDEVQARKEMLDKSLHLHHLKNIPMNTKKQNRLISDWLEKASDGDKMTLPLEKGVHKYFQLCVFRFGYPRAWADEKDGKIIVEKISAKKKEEYLNRVGEEEQQCVLNDYLGFGLVFRMLKEYKKPLIGHNVLMDLLLFYQSFYKPLPRTVKEFKNNLHLLFPSVYDTKHMWLNVKQVCQLGRLSAESGLYELYELLKSPPENLIVLFSPGVEHKSAKYYSESLLHNAGYDSFLCGWVFLKICHILAIKKTKSLAHVVPQSWHQHHKAVKPFENKINISRARVHFIDLSGEDPPSHRPEFLYVRIKDVKSSLNLLEVEKKLGLFGFVEVRQISHSEALVAVASFGCAKDILRHLSNDRQFYVDRYSFWRHWWLGRTAIWISCGASTCFSLFLLFKLLQSNR